MATERILEELPQETNGEKTRWDPELLAIQRVIRILDDLAEPAQTRALAYLALRYQFVCNHVVQEDDGDTD